MQIDGREAFEAWAKEQGYQRDELARDKIGIVSPEYFNLNTENAYRAWQAAPASTAKGYDGGIQTGNRVTLIFETQEEASSWFESFSDSYDRLNGTQSLALPIPTEEPTK